MDKILEVKDLHVSFAEERKSLFEKKKRIEVLKGLDFHINEGEIVGLVGESGCGKSTLAKSILGLVKPTQGKIIISSKEHPQMVFQDPKASLNPAKTVRFILEEPLRNLTDKSPEERFEKAADMIEKVGLSKEYLDRYPDELSGGQRQRISIAASLMMDPKLLIADEPVSALDVTVQAQVLELLKELHKSLNLAIIFISHDLRVVYQLCDRVMVMKNGLIVEQNTRDEIYRNPKHEYTKSLLKSAGIGL